MATTTRRDGEPRARRVLSRADNPLVRAVGRLPLPVQTKFLLPSVATVVLLVVLGVLGLQVLGESNDRVVELGQLQQRATAYRGIQTEALEIRNLLLERTAIITGTCNTVTECLGSSRSIGNRILTVLSGRGKADDPTTLGFTAPADEQSKLAQIAQDYVRLTDVMVQMVQTDNIGVSVRLQQSDAAPLARDIQELADALVVTTQGRTSWIDWTAIVERTCRIGVGKVLPGESE